jgi:hypothetical protein
MKLLESPMSSANQLIMGPDGAVYVLPAGTLAPFQPPGGLDRVIASPSVQRHSRLAKDDGGQGTSCFMYSPGVALEDDGEGTSCSMHGVTSGDGGTSGGCFRY